MTYLKQLECQSCGQLMKIVLKKKVKGKIYRVRKFYCGLCDLYETVYGGGQRDIVDHPLKINTKEIDEAQETETE